MSLSSEQRTTAETGALRELAVFPLEIHEGPEEG
jgi:hypothetical protein